MQIYNKFLKYQNSNNTTIKISKKHHPIKHEGYTKHIRRIYEG